MARKTLAAGYKTFNGKTLTASQVESYNRIQERINSFEDAGLPVPEYLLNGSHNLFYSFCHG